MNLIQRLKAPTPAKYKAWGKTFKWLSGALVAGVVAINTVNLTLAPDITKYISIAIFVTASASTACYAQVEDISKVEENK